MEEAQAVGAGPISGVPSTTGLKSSGRDEASTVMCISCVNTHKLLPTSFNSYEQISFFEIDAASRSTYILNFIITMTSTTPTAALLPMATSPTVTASAAPPTIPIKQYEVYRRSSKRYEIQQNGQAVLFADLSGSVFTCRQVNVKLQDQSTTAVCESHALKRNMPLLYSKPDSTTSSAKADNPNPDEEDKPDLDDDDKSNWPKLIQDPKAQRKWKFSSNGRSLSWTRLESKLMSQHWVGFKALGYQLTDETTGQLLALFTYIPRRRGIRSGYEGTIDFHVELGSELEYLSLAAILALKRRNAAAENIACAFAIPGSIAIGLAVGSAVAFLL